MQGIHNARLFKEACYINGQWMQSDSGRTIPVRNPFNGDVLGHIPECGREETQRAIEAANTAWHPWRNLSAKERSDLLWAWAHLIDQNKEDLARIMTQEQGKPLEESRGEIDYANGFIKWFAEEGRRVYGDVIPSNKRNQHLVVIKQPVGVVAAITPWNFPAAMITRKIAPALAVGCTVVVKPDEETPYSAFALAVLAEQAGIPAGVLNVITGIPELIGAEFTANLLVRKLSFTGSTAVGRLLMKQCAPTIKKITLELGGNAPFIVFDDADLDAAVEGAIASKFRNTGQTCVCANRILVQDSVYAEFAKKLVHAVRQLKVGNGLEPGIQQGPLINESAFEKVKLHIDDAVAKGAQVVCGGKPHPLGGLFFEPTVLTGANTSMRLAKEETFGPVAPLFRFHTEEEAILLSNDTEFGLASYFYSKHIDRIWRVAEALEYGMVGINAGIVSTEVAPFGGVKQSGIGREGSKYGIDPYVEIKYLCMQG
ncbi:NAD-dependent succinate-semialdehyde dehydrogenase [Aquicella lusitana]|uniref:Succinate-semialdehyde dehydrogenase/glutarate-semialdehyde dehydrogenase n=1 Tax=Aquicella lusitana TaxID=254246 RepID=A0A370GAY2_9COXI|nr:NAD-dependent succinate-semialdehyde dehydrogenase [Aquicella lusitana]RDI40209.1 succinate-semialdehyde dehydrogenase/glutarate-semialdehyde dehydrogenase [Aquicella lusitana]VVC72400.1 Glutarate-semialdehyde dehydrogenase DavD [Aquicella lusitana]